MPGNLLYKELAQASCPSGDEIAPALFPGEASRRGDLCMLLPLSDPTLAVSITHVRLLRSELVLTQPGEQIPFIWFPLNFYQLAPQRQILLLCHLEHTDKGL